ncbi:predicted protein [Coccidioides posadasii str. Silveira]|uniref:Predicted protein n=1 Tax=Coccidioides posadasii (strain RMSCC 757 / Silveira) TaxID=443226 RepID=E9DGT7_COCPS|nr:predicted protein [Coccidioides posadasii str. Silveira]
MAHWQFLARFGSRYFFSNIEALTQSHMTLQPMTMRETRHPSHRLHSVAGLQHSPNRSARVCGVLAAGSATARRARGWRVGVGTV